MPIHLNGLPFSKPALTITFVSGQYYDAKSVFLAPDIYGTIIMVADLIYFTPFCINSEGPVSFDRIGFEKTGGPGTRNIRIGVYNDNGCLPGTLIFQTEFIAPDANIGHENVIAQTLNPGNYWLAIIMSATSTLRDIGTSTGFSLSADSLTDITPHMVRTAVQTYGALPATAPATTKTGDDIPRIMLRVA